MGIGMGQGRRTVGRVLGTVAVALATVATSLTLGVGSASAAPQTLPQPVRERVAQLQTEHPLQHRRAQSGHRTPLSAEVRRTSRLEASPTPGGDDDIFLVADPGCVSRKGGKASVDATIWSSTKTKFDYVLTAGGNYRKTGSITAKAQRDTSLKLPSVHVGSYRLTLARHGTTALLADETFDVAACVQVKAGCYAISLTNPAGNPTADVSYGGKHGNNFDLVLAPGQTRTVRVDDKKVLVQAFAEVDEKAEFVFLGQTTVKVKRSCKHGPAQPGQNAVQTTAFMSCGQGGAPGSAGLSWAAQTSLKNRTWEIVDAQQAVVASGSYKNGRDKLVALAPGLYTYRSHANKLAQPLEEVAFSVLDCVTVATSCHRIDVTNPNDVAVEAYVIDTDEDSDVVDPGEGDGPTLLAPKATTSIDWRTRSAVLLAIAADTSSRSRFVSLASNFPLDDEQDFPEITVPQNC